MMIYSVPRRYANFDLHLRFLPRFFLGWKFCVMAMFWDELFGFGMWNMEVYVVVD